MNAPVHSRARLDIPPWLAILLLLPLLGILPPVPVDETRYLSIAWEMRQSGDLIALHLNGFPYFDKPPLLFWLLNLGWSLFGVSFWAARAMTVLFAAGCIGLITLIERHLAGAEARQAPWLLFGFFYFLLFSGVVMFDIALCFFVLLAFLALIRWLSGGDGWALALLYLAAGLGMLTKGPVMLLHLAGPVLLSRWWMPQAARPTWRQLGVLLLTVLLAGLPVLLWALAAVHHWGGVGAKELLVTQTAGRVVDSFAHNRAFWWYLIWLPLILLPWPLVLRWTRVRSAVSGALHTVAGRFGLSASLPALLGFCFISGKQLHYLLPLFPGVALLLGAMLRVEASLLSPRRLLSMVMLVACLLVWTIVRPGDTWAYPLGHKTTAGLFLLAAMLLVWAVIVLFRRKASPEQRVALTALLLIMALLPMLHMQLLGAMDVRGLAQRVASLRQQGVPLARVGDEPGLITFFARLPEPLPTAGDPLQWAQQHPDGFLLVWSSRSTAPADLQDGIRVARGWAGLRPAATWPITPVRTE
ncbi:ArnT family glycosyltransferase [Dyella silvatica]|uniref:ArnT family glycosyltransferase n=1 Tax=Dyella silvatica TaxID=2992128 RepID=UPI002257F547|nr:glycosyltransferase family 39 protein [Dyella silvatica]